MKRTDAELIAALESMGTPWHEHFLLNDGLVGFKDENGRIFAHVIEDDDLNALVCEFLRKNGKVEKRENN